MNPGTTQLVRYEQARQALQIAHSVDEVKDIRDKAQAVAAYARQAKDTALVEWATEIKVRAERKAGEMLAHVERSNGGRGKTSSSVEQVYRDNDIARSTGQRWQKLAAVPEEQFEQAVAAAKEVAGEVTTAAMLRLNHNHRAQYTGETEWYTPAEYIEAVRAFFGEIDLDPASSDVAQRRVKAKAFYTERDDGLSKVWAGRVWMNPPYAQPLIAHFMQKLAEEYNGGNVREAIALTHNSTDTSWFHLAQKSSSALCFTRGRIAFLDPRGAPCAPTQGQAFFYFGKRVKGFAQAFSKFGFVVISHE